LTRWLKFPVSNQLSPVNFCWHTCWPHRYSTLAATDILIITSSSKQGKCFHIPLFSRSLVLSPVAIYNSIVDIILNRIKQGWDVWPSHILNMKNWTNTLELCKNLWCRILVQTYLDSVVGMWAQYLLSSIPVITSAFEDNAMQIMPVLFSNQNSC
jgi:hypothetical protein